MAIFSECKIDNCSNPAKAKELCAKHYSRGLLGSDKQTVNTSPMPKCAVSHCKRFSASRTEGSLCDSHYQFSYRGVDPETKMLRKDDSRADTKCWVKECPRRANQKSLCTMHARKAKLGKLEVPAELGILLNPECSFGGCAGISEAKGLCHSHYCQQRDGFELSPLREYGVFTSGSKSCAVVGCAGLALAGRLCPSHAGKKSTYGLNIAELSKLHAKSECENPGCTNTKRLHIDHDHDTGKVRGMLCNGCNTSLGHLGEDIERILGLAEYKKLHS